MADLKYIPLQLSDFENCDWRTVISAAERKECKSYYRGFFDKADKADDERHSEVYTLLGAITSLYLRPDINGIYKPSFNSGHLRGFIIDDFSVNHLNVLTEFLELVDDDELKSRIADVVWIKGRSKYYKVVPIAIKSYTASATNLLESAPSRIGLKHSMNSIKRFDRALDLSMSANQSELATKIIKLIESIIDNADKTSLNFPFIALLKILLRYRSWVDAEIYMILCDTLAIESQIQNRWIDAVSYWGAKADWALVSEDTETNRQSNINCAEAYVKVAEIYGKPPRADYGAAITNLKFAMEQLRRQGGMQSRCNELHSLIVKYQRLNSQNLSYHSFPFEVGDIPDKVVTTFSNLEWQDSIIKLALINEPIDVEVVRERVKGYLYGEEFSFQFLFTTQLLDADGRPKAQIPSLIGASEKDVEIATKYRLHYEANLMFHLQVAAIISPAIQQLHKDHYVQLSNWEFLVRNNSFVPPDRALLYMKGLHAGFRGDHITALHILIPQIENSLRYLLEQNGIQAYSIDTVTGIQQAHTLETLFETPELMEIMDNDISFTLKSLLIRKFGNNYRNEMSHGLMSAGQFYQPNIVYLWWFVLHLLVRGISPIIQHEDENET